MPAQQKNVDISSLGLIEYEKGSLIIEPPTQCHLRHRFVKKLRKGCNRTAESNLPSNRVVGLWVSAHQLS